MSIWMLRILVQLIIMMSALLFCTERGPNNIWMTSRQIIFCLIARLCESRIQSTYYTFLEMFLAWLRVFSLIFFSFYLFIYLFILPLCLTNIFHFTPFLLNVFTPLIFKRPPAVSLKKSPDEKPLVAFIIKYSLFFSPFFHLHLPSTWFL